ncbi:hypothetical protein [Streptomyces sp. Caat 7-52]|uniref:hypothetical protein n=1 Tax=Streptomyces sp. Caat 7-52 TaxID=2949637 RepID=UPI002035E510|nr:hypothetical protein [Streptomyces sp. Caat 7-52]
MTFDECKRGLGTDNRGPLPYADEHRHRGGNRQRWAAVTAGRAVSFAYYVSLTLSAKPGAEERAEAPHIKTAFQRPEDTKPYMSAKKVPGQTVKVQTGTAYSTAWTTASS